MNRRSKAGRSFLNSTFFLGIAIVLVAVLLGSYFFDSENIENSEVPFDTLIVDQNYYSPSKYENWHTINLRYFTIEVPETYRFFIGRGIDSYVGGITNQIDTLSFDYGWYSDDLSEFETMRNFKVTTEEIHGRRFKIVKEIGEKGTTAVFIDDLEDDNKLDIFCENCLDIDEKVQMFRTLKFNR